jgi:selenoprotein W-related protein
MAEFERQIESWSLIPGGGGVFEITLDGDLVYSKKATGQHPTTDEVRQAIGDRLA